MGIGIKTMRTGFTRPLKTLRWAIIALAVLTPAASPALGAPDSGRGTRDLSLMATTPRTAGFAEARSGALAAIYGRAAQDINERLAAAVRRLASEPGSGAATFAAARSAVLLRQIDSILAELGRTGPRAVRALTAEAWGRGAVAAVAEARAMGWVPPTAAGREAMSPDFTRIDAGAVETIAADTAARLTGAARRHAVRAATLFRTLALSGDLRRRVSEPALNEAIARGLVQGNPRLIERNVRELFRDGDDEAGLTYRKLGNQVIEVGGWSGTVRTYAGMVAHTRAREAIIRGRHERLERLDIGLVQIIGSRTVNFCTRFLDLVCALTSGASEGGRYPLLSSLPQGGPPFHPRCRKDTRPYIPALVGATSPERAAEASKAAERFERDKEAGRLEAPLAA